MTTKANAPRQACQHPLLIGLAAVLLVGAACGGDDADTSSPTIGAATATSDAGIAVDGTFPVTLQQMTGDVTIPAKPDRVATLGYTDTDIANALGANIVIAVASPFGDDGVNPYWAVTPLDASVATIDPIEPNLEAIAAADPDIILATAAYPSVIEMYDALSAIAPVVTPITGPLLDSATDLTAVIGRALGEDAASAALLTATDDAIEAFRAANPDLAGKTAVFAPREGEQTALFVEPEAASVSLLDQLGLTVPGELGALPGDRIFGATFVSDEQLELLDTADIAIVGLYTEASRTTFMSLPIVQNLEITEAGSLIEIDRPLGAALQTPNPVSIPYVLVELGPRLAAAAG